MIGPQIGRPTEAEPSTITVIIPTYNRSAYLRLCLKYLEAQTVKHFDVVVVNDGSFDDTEAVLREIAQTTPLRLRAFTQPNGRIPRARNHAVTETRTELLIMIGDDMMVAPEFVETHLEFHRAHSDEATAAIGWITWDTRHQRVTPFMQWLDHRIFDYVPLLAGETPTWRRFYGSNFSCKTRLLRETPYDERFREYGNDDLELGYRLTITRNLRLAFLKAAHAAHLHPTTLLEAMRRIHWVGYSDHRLNEYWPSTRVQAGTGWRFAVARLLSRQAALLDGITRLAATQIGEKAAGKLGSLLLHSHYYRGYLEYPQNHAFEPDREHAVGVGNAASGD